MAAVVRGGHPRQGGRGRGHARGGRARGGAPPVADEPGQVINPVGFQWAFWKEGNTNTSKKMKQNKDLELELKIYRELENNPKIDQDELHSYGVSVGLLDQDEGIVRMLNEAVALYNRMATTRRRYLFKKLHGAHGKEVSLMAKKIQYDSELAMSLVEDIKTSKGYCPATPTVFSALPKLY